MGLSKTTNGTLEITDIVPDLRELAYSQIGLLSETHVYNGMYTYRLDYVLQNSIQSC